MQSSLIILLLSFFVSFHNFHSTHTTVYYDEKEETIEITVRVAIDDLERAIEDKGVKNLKIGSDDESPSAEKLINSYLKQRLIIWPNNQSVEYEWVGKEVSKDFHDIYLYFEIANCSKNEKINSLYVENTIFTELIPNQANIVLIQFEENKRNLTFSKAKSSQYFLFTDE